MPSPKKSPTKFTGVFEENIDVRKIAIYVLIMILIIVVIYFILNVFHPKRKCQLAFYSPLTKSIYMVRGGAAFPTFDDAAKACKKIENICGAVEKAGEGRYVLRKFAPKTGIVIAKPGAKTIKLMKVEKGAMYGTPVWNSNTNYVAKTVDTAKTFDTMDQVIAEINNNKSRYCGFVLTPDKKYQPATDCSSLMYSSGSTIFYPSFKYTSGTPVSRNIATTETMESLESTTKTKCNANPLCTSYTKVINTATGAVAGYVFNTESYGDLMRLNVDNGNQTYFKLTKGIDYVVPTIVMQSVIDTEIINNSKASMTDQELTDTYGAPRDGYTVIGDIISVYGDAIPDTSFGTFIDVNNVPDGPGAKLTMPNGTTLDAAEAKCDTTPGCNGITKAADGVYYFSAVNTEKYPMTGYTSYPRV